MSQVGQYGLSHTHTAFPMRRIILLTERKKIINFTFFMKFIECDGTRIQACVSKCPQN